MNPFNSRMTPNWGSLKAIGYKFFWQSFEENAWVMGATVLLQLSFLLFSRMVHNCDLVNMQCKYDCNRGAFGDGILFVLWGHYTSTFDGTFVHVYFLSKINLDTLRCYLLSIFLEAARVPSLAGSRLQKWCILSTIYVYNSSCTDMSYSNMLCADECCCCCRFPHSHTLGPVNRVHQAIHHV